MVDDAPSAVGGAQMMRRLRTILDGTPQNGRALLSRTQTLRRRRHILNKEATRNMNSYMRL